VKEEAVHKARRKKGEARLAAVVHDGNEKRPMSSVCIYTTANGEFQE
jgi:hypothetical protein